MNDHAWNELLDEFRVLGGIADNVRLGFGRLGRGLFPIDPMKPVAIQVPSSLLIKSCDMSFSGGKFQVAPGLTIGARERAWLDRYHETISWGGGGRHEIEQMFAMAHELPAELRHRLLTKFRCGTWFGDATDEAVRQHFLKARQIASTDSVVIMPIIECTNHGPGATFNANDGLSLSGQFAEEVLVKYSDLDAFGFFKTWGFAYPCPAALSIALKGQIESRSLWIARRQFSDGQHRSMWIPDLLDEDGHQTLTYLLLGHEEYPRLAKGVFYRLMREAGYSDVESCFSQIHQANRAHFQGLLEAVRGLSQPIAQTLTAMAEYQLRAMTFSQDFS